jgi:taurine dioxygenase
MTFKIRSIAGALGAELHGIDLSADLPDSTIAAIRQALLDHLVIFFRDQDLPPDRFATRARRFGTPIEYPFVKGIEGFPGWEPCRANSSGTGCSGGAAWQNTHNPSGAARGDLFNRLRIGESL